MNTQPTDLHENSKMTTKPTNMHAASSFDDFSLESSQLPLVTARARSTVCAPPAPKRVRGRVQGIDDGAFFDTLPKEQLDAWEGRAVLPVRGELVEP